MTKTQQKEIVFALVVEAARWRDLRNEAARNVRRIDAQVAAMLAVPVKKRRAGGAARRATVTSNAQSVSARKNVASSLVERKRGLARQADVFRRAAKIARRIRVTPEVER